MTKPPLTERFFCIIPSFFRSILRRELRGGRGTALFALRDHQHHDERDDRDQKQRRHVDQQQDEILRAVRDAVDQIAERLRCALAEARLDGRVRLDLPRSITTVEYAMLFSSDFIFAV